MEGAGSAGRNALNQFSERLKPSPNDGSSAKAIVDYFRDTPERFGRNVDAAFPDPRLLKQDDAEGQAAREAAAGSALNFGGMMIGPKARTWATADAAKAEQMAAAGVDARQIWKETGTWKGPDGAWRQEIPDNASVYRGSLAANSSQAENVMSHPELYNAYPSLASNRVIESPRPGGEYSVYDGTITVGPNDARSTMLHESQHAIQEKENWAKGGMPATARELQDHPYPPVLDPIVNEYRDLARPCQRVNARK